MKSSPFKRHLSPLLAIGIALASMLVPLGAHPWRTTAGLLSMLKAVGIVPDNPLTSLGANQQSFILPDNPPVISSQPQNQLLIPGNDVTFSVSAGGSAPLSYQWRKDNVNIDGATASSYTRPNVQAIDEGNYSVVISNAVGSATSDDALLAFIIAPTITVQPQSQTVGAGENVTLTVTATGAKPLTYQWERRRGGGTGPFDLISWFGSGLWTNSSLPLNNVQGSEIFRVRVNNAYG